MWIRILLFLIISVLWVGYASADSSISNSNINVRLNPIKASGQKNQDLDSFIGPITNFFFKNGIEGSDWVINSFVLIAYNIKNFFIAIAVIFLIYAILRLLYSSNDEEDLQKWRNNILWTTIGIFLMQISWSTWNVLILTEKGQNIWWELGWRFWETVFGPIVGILQMLASMAFIFMAIWAFYLLITASDDTERSKKAKLTIFYAIVGFLLIRVPKAFVEAIYGKASCAWWGSMVGCTIRDPRLADAVGIVGKVINFINGFLAVFCVIMVIYAGFLVFISGGEEDKLKKAKRVVLYIVIWLALLLTSHTLFRFFILKDI